MKIVPAVMDMRCEIKKKEKRYCGLVVRFRWIYDRKDMGSNQAG